MDRYIFFTGYLLQDKYKYQLENHNPYVFSSHDYREVADTIFSKLPIFCQGTALDKKNKVGVAPVNWIISQKIVGDKLRYGLET